ncbi:MAG TPA: hypothetical protein VI757_02915, partial [Bacteroidia bacterium]|nr:hypothetical protein [Bacteroidia bacterium]
MKTSLKKILSAGTQNFVSLLFIISFSSSAQTNVSGGIYSNATWTLAGSPYIVVDTIVVFPGVTLTIQPGVVVKFDNSKRLDIRGTLIASGTITDSITFTSNSATPTPGIYSSVYLYGSTSITFNYCNFLYGTNGLLGQPGNGTSLIVKNSTFKFNVCGFAFNGGTSAVITVDSCYFSKNKRYGLNCNSSTITIVTINHSYFHDNDSLGLQVGTGATAMNLYIVKNCVIDSNRTGLYSRGWKLDSCTISSNQTGIYSGGYNRITNCVIDSNSAFGISHVSWPDSIINNMIRYNGIGLDGLYAGLITRNTIELDSIGAKANYIIPSYFYCNKLCNSTAYDLYYTSPANVSIPNNYWCTADSDTIATHIYDGYDDISYGLVHFYPVDTSQCFFTGCNLQVTANVTNATCDTCHNGSATAVMYYGFPPYIYTWLTSPIQTTQTATGLASGTYTVCVTDAQGCTACNSNVFVDSTNCTGFAITANAVNASCTLCNDGSATASVTAGTPPYSYTWYTSPIQTTDTATGLPQGNYAVCVTDLYGCT